MHNQIILQSPTASGAILHAARELFLDPRFTRARIAVAYLTATGACHFIDVFQSGGNPDETFLVAGLDGFITEPDAIEALLPWLGDRFRLFSSGEQRSVFHIKAYSFDDSESESFAILVGSANASGQGFGRNREGATLTIGQGQEIEIVSHTWGTWWDDIWAEAETITRSRLAAYRAEFDLHIRDTIVGDRLQTVRLDGEPDEVADADTVPAADMLWLDAGLTGGSDTQLELPRPTVPFFGVDPSQPRTVHLTLVVGGLAVAGNQLRFYQNDMWRINVDSTIAHAVGGLRGRTLAFARRKARNEYTFSVLTVNERQRVRTLALAADNLGATRTREYGWR